MNVLFLSVDSLRRDFLNAYPEEPPIDVRTPNFDKFAERAAVFDTHFAGSQPCMPARREWFSGYQGFLWRPWGPLEPFDQTLPQRARSAGALAAMITDHFHYFQHGSSGYYEDFHGFEFIRGHEDDAWKTSPKHPDRDMLRQVGYEFGDRDNDEDLFQGGISAGDPTNLQDFRPRAQYVRNTQNLESEEDFFAPKVFSAAADWLDRNQEWKKWFLYIDSFDVHEPFHNPEKYATMYTDENPTDPDLPLWPFYGPVDEGQSALTDRQLDFVRAQFAGKVTMVDEWFGRVLETLDENALWDDTMVVVTADHGFLLGEHGRIGKLSPDFNELIRTPLMIWHPDSPRMGGRVDALTAAVDLYATLLEGLDAEIPSTVHSKSLMPLLMDTQNQHRKWALYGCWGQGIGITDGEYTYLHPCDENEPVYSYSTQMLNSWGWMAPPRPNTEAEGGQFLPYTDTPVWKVESESHRVQDEPLLHRIDDFYQQHNLTDEEPQIADGMRDTLRQALADMEAPDSQFDRLRL